MKKQYPKYIQNGSLVDHITAILMAQNGVDVVVDTVERNCDDYDVIRNKPKLMCRQTTLGIEFEIEEMPVKMFIPTEVEASQFWLLTGDNPPSILKAIDFGFNQLPEKAVQMFISHCG